MTETEVTESRLAAALAAFQAEVPSVVKGATATVETKAGGQYKYQYADLAVITPLVLPLLGKHGLAWSAQPSLMGDMFVLHYSLMHESGESIEGIYPLPDPLGIKPQELGSAITYARRYALCAVTGVAPGGDDDDAQSANDKPAATRARRQQPPKPAPAPEPVRQVSERNWAADIIDVKSVDDLRKVHQEAEKAAELGFELNPEYSRFLDGVVEHFGLEKPTGRVTVGGLIRAVKAGLEQSVIVVSAGESPADGPVTEWPVVQPGTGTPS